MTCSPDEKTDRQTDRYVNKKIHTNRVFSRMSRSVTAESSPTKFCTSTPWGDVVIYLTTSKLVLGFWRGRGCENWPLPLTLALASNTAYCATAHRREYRVLPSGLFFCKSELNVYLLQKTSLLWFLQKHHNCITVQRLFNWLSRIKLPSVDTFTYGYLLKVS